MVARHKSLRFSGLSRSLHTRDQALVAGACAVLSLLFPTALQQPQSSARSGGIEQQPFVCDEDGIGTGSANFVSNLGHFSLQLNIADKSNVVVGCVFHNAAGIPLSGIQIDYKGKLNDTFGPYLVLTFRNTAGKTFGKVVPFNQAVVIPSPDNTDSTKTLPRLAFTLDTLGVPQAAKTNGVMLQGLEIMAIGENDGGTATVGDVFINGNVTGKLLNTITSCDPVP